jgi:rhamnosyltransferase
LGTHNTRIAIIGSRGIPAAYGGYETIVQEIAPRLSRKGFEVYVSCESRWFKLRSHANYRGVGLVYFPVIDAIRNLSEVLLYDALCAFWAAFSADIVYMLAYTSAPTLILPKLCGKTVIVNVDGIEWRRPKYNSFLRFLLHAFEILSTRIADYTIVDSHAVGAYYERNYGVTPVYIPYGITEIRPLGPEALKSFGVTKDEYYLVIGRLIPDNNIDLIIEAFVGTHSSKKLLIVGPLNRTRYVQRLLQQRDERIVFAGGVYEPRLQRALRHNCFAYIHGHEMGGTNPSLVEALSCGNVTLAIDVEFNREVAEDCAIYFKKQANDLAKKIDLLERSPVPTQMKKGAYALYRKKYDAENAVRMFLEFLGRICSP